MAQESTDRSDTKFMADTADADGDPRSGCKNSQRDGREHIKSERTVTRTLRGVEAKQMCRRDGRKTHQIRTRRYADPSRRRGQTNVLDFMEYEMRTPRLRRG